MSAHPVPACLSMALSLSLMLGCEATPPVPAALTEQDEATLRGIFDTVVETVRAGDFAAWAAVFAEDAVFHPSNGPAVHGRGAIQAWGEALPAVAGMGFSDVQVWGEGNLAWGTSAIAIAFQDLPPDTSKQLVVFRRDASGTWKVAAVSFNSDLPIPTAAAGS